MNSFNFSFNAGTNYELSQPEWLWLIPVYLLIAIIINIIKDKYLSKSNIASLAENSTKQQFLHPLINLLNKHSNKIITRPYFNIIYFIIFSLLIIALTQPVKIGKQLPEPPQERDIIFIIDTSVSMILRDYILNDERIDRMSLLKVLLDKFIQDLKGERMSIIVFGDHAYTLVPLTSDQSLLRRMLSRVQATMAGRFNAIGEAIALAVKQSSVFNNKTKNNKRKRVLVLLTDADQPTGKIDPITAAKLAQHAQLPLYTIAIGATSLTAGENQLGGLLYSPVDLNLLKQLSTLTGASNYQAGSPDALKKAIQAIHLHGTNKRKVKPLYFREALFYWLLMAAFIIFSLQQFITLLFNQHNWKK